MPNTAEQVAYQNDEAYRSKIDPQYLDKIPAGEARTYFENNPSKRLHEYLNEDYQGKVFNALITCEEEDSEEEDSEEEDFNVLLSIEDIIIRTIHSNTSENIVRAAKLVLSIPDIYKQTYMLYLIQLVLKYQTKDNEITEIFLKNASNYNGFKGVIRYIAKGSANVEVQNEILSFILENPPLYEMLTEGDFSSIVDGCRYSQGSGDSEGYKTRGDIIRIILKYANKDTELCNKIPTRLALLDWGSYVGARSFGSTYSYINDIIKCKGLVMRISDEDLKEFLTDNTDDNAPYFRYHLTCSDRELAVQKIKRIQEAEAKAPAVLSQFFDSVPPRNANQTADESVRLHSSMQTKLSQ